MLTHTLPRATTTGKENQERATILPQGQGTGPKVPRARAAPSGSKHGGTEEGLELLGSLPASNLGSIGINMDLQLVQQEAHRPAGGRLQYFCRNWEQIYKDTWVLHTISGCKLEFTHSPHLRKELTQIYTPGQTEGPSTRRRTPEDGEQTGYRTCKGPLRGMLCQPNVCGTQIGWVMETSDKFEGA